ncbi:MAG: PilZ domain-containing protein [Candidatus Omnitrophica bacterium]|nr:PilZ domain-containing protein [Candidatus Omnitrophota bacterium]
MERRQSPRIKIEFPIKIKLTGSSLPALRAQGVDLSEQGIRVALEDNISLPQDPILEFVPLSLPKIRTHAQLIWRQGHNYGLRFKNLGAEDSLRLKKLSGGYLSGLR